MKAAVTGDGLTFMKYVKQIVKKYPRFDEGVPHIYDGAFKLGACVVGWLFVLCHVGWRTGKRSITCC